LLTGKIYVENPEKNYRFLNIESTAKCKHHIKEITGCYCRAACGAGGGCPSGAPDFTSGFYGGSCCPVVCVSLFRVIVLYFGF